MTLSCHATGNPVPTISWTRGGSALKTMGNLNISFSKDKTFLSITNVNRNDGGEYRCVAENKVGNVTSSAKVNIQCEYRIVYFGCFFCTSFSSVVLWFASSRKCQPSRTNPLRVTKRKRTWRPLGNWGETPDASVKFCSVLFSYSWFSRDVIKIQNRKEY